LNAMAGVTQGGSSKTCVTAAPRAKERTLYIDKLYSYLASRHPLVGRTRGNALLLRIGKYLMPVSKCN